MPRKFQQVSWVLSSPLMIILRQVAQGLLEKYSWQSARPAPCWRMAACPACSSAPEQCSPTTFPSLTTTRPSPRIWKYDDSGQTVANERFKAKLYYYLFYFLWVHFTDLTVLLFLLWFLRKHLHPQAQQGKQVNLGQPGAMTWVMRRFDTVKPVDMLLGDGRASRV